jgi:CRISPR-associated endonuclease/helicase Cas3
MSATLPKIGSLTWNEKVPDFVSLITDKKKYFQNENFKGRVHFDFSLLKWSKPIAKEEQKELYLPKLSDKVFEESKKYAQREGNVFTIIEFIFKRTASDFYQIADLNNDGFFDRIFVLSGTILEPRRKEIIEFVKNENNRNKNILLITTQVVESGVDIDMDLGFKDKSLVDSDEQLAGRINRNVKKKECTLFIFDCDDASFIYGTDRRYKVLQQSKQDEYERILVEKSFDKVYNKVIDDRKKHNEGLLGIGLSDFRKKMQDLNYVDVEESFELIKDQNYSVFVQLDIPIFIPETEKRNFTESELLFLKENNRLTEEDACVSGENVWNLYTDIIKSKSDDFVEQKIRMKKIQSILSKFTFSIFAQSKDAKKLIEHGYKDADFGFIRLFDLEENEDAIYKYESGLADKNLQEALIF